MSDTESPAEPSTESAEAAMPPSEPSVASENENTTVETVVAADADASDAPQSAGNGAVDTGRRIDPALLSQGRKTLRRGGRDAPPESEIEVPEGVAPATVLRVVERPLGNDTGDHDVVDAAAIAARAEAAGGAGEARAPRADRPRGDRGDRGPRNDRNDRGDRGDRKGARGGRGRDEKPAAPREPRIDFSGMAPIVVKRDDDVGDFASMFEEAGGVDHRSVRIGDKIRAKVVHIGSDSVFFEVSKTQQAHSPRGEFLDDKTGELTIDVGDSVDAFVIGMQDGLVISPKLGRDQIDVGMLEEAKASSIPVDGTITGVNKGGFEISLGGSTRGFCPTGQIDINFIEDPASLVGKTFSFLVREVKEKGRNVVLSRRSLLEKERVEKSKKLLETLAIGSVIDGVVTRIQPFGAFVDLGGIDGLVPVSELSHGRVASPGDVVQVGEHVRVEVTRMEDDPKRPGQLRIALSMKAMQTDPLVARMGDLHPGAEFVGRVVRLETFGAFIELFDGIEGLVHISEISDRRIRHPEDVLKEDERVQVRVKDVDLARRRVSLSMRDASNDTVEADAVESGAPRAAKPRLGRGTKVIGVVDRIERYGVFLNLFAEDSNGEGEQLGSALMPAVETGTPRGSDLGKAFPIGTKVPVLVIDVDDRGRIRASKTGREQAEERAVVDQYKTDKGAGGKAGLGTFADLLKAKLGG